MKKTLAVLALAFTLAIPSFGDIIPIVIDPEGQPPSCPVSQQFCYENCVDIFGYRYCYTVCECL